MTELLKILFVGIIIVLLIALAYQGIVQFLMNAA